ncbi:uncharacterized protein LOC133195867 [Saccostrea echinata]|uniref:uncharacterized protein LOC133195867 n=1 Tax=Saccostrea echinata TaxID=191078 RepID=UPI002A83BD37|nr:uncharacterized protein LOC133195867 [Saccostrea echinata]
MAPCSVQNLYLTFADWEHPNYSYRCLENGDVELFGVHAKSSIKVEGNPQNCNHSHEQTTHVYWIKSTCLSVQNNANISVYDFDFDGVSQPPGTPTTTIAPNIVGGHGGHQFVITCKDIPGTGIIRTVAHVFQEKIYNKLPDNYKEVASVEMRFKAVNDTAAPDISTVYIGDEFYMFIKYMGKESYNVIPEKCSAFGETWIPKGPATKPADKSVDLWNIQKAGNGKDKCAEQKELLEIFGRYNETLIYAKMYGFRFAEGNYVTITCEVKIFNSLNVTDKTVSKKTFQ